MNNSKRKPKLLLVDGHSLAFRSFYAFTKGTEGGLTTREGFPTSVTYGFLKSLLDNCKSISPQGVTIAFDTAEPTFRHKADPNYKANRDVAPEIFFQDLQQLQEILKECLKLNICSKPGYEADDVLGTLANQAVNDGWEVLILSGDRDLFQLVDDLRGISILYMGGGPYSKSGSPTLIKEKGVKEKLGVAPKKVVDLKALTGDSSDNIPGVKGVGPKTAINLLKENNDLDGVYSSLNKLQKLGDKASQGAIKGAIKNKLIKDKGNAYLSRYLAEILIDVPFGEKPIFQLENIDEIKFSDVLEELDLNSLLRQLPEFKSTFSKGGYINNEKIKNSISNNQNILNNQNEEDYLSKNKQILPPNIQAKIIETESELNKLKDKLMQYKNTQEPIAIDTETTSLNPFKAQLVGIGICWGSELDQIAYIPIGHITSNKVLSDNTIINQLDLEIVIGTLKEWFCSKLHPKALQNTKYDRLILLRHGILLEGVVFDTLLADYLCDTNFKHSIEEIAIREFGFKPTKFTDIVKKGETFASIDIKSASIYCGMDVYLTRKIYKLLKNRIEGMGSQLSKLLNEVELPLEKVLAEMEATGISIDINYLKELSEEIKESLKTLEEQAHLEGGQTFNLASPKQLGELLFEKMGLDKKKSRRTKTGWSTDANVLEKLEPDHPIIKKLIEHRTLSKLLSTYVDALPELIEKETGRVHTDFNQAVTTTGRLSSSNPNLQNIPIRTNYSRQIRKAFLPQNGWKMLSADYSQIELRILSHLSGEDVLQEAYKNNEDVHALTAKLLLEKNSVNDQERRLGKTLNFGVIYGMGAQRFARSAGVNISEARTFLNLFKERYPKVFSFLELQERLALSKGYVETLFGRRRYFHFNPNGLGRLLGKSPEEIDLSTARRAGMEAQQLRAAANAPIQGSSADIIKIAMVKLQHKLKKKNLPGRLLLQVHDELVLEVDPTALREVKELVIKTMEEAVCLSIPLKVETGFGNNWMEAK